VTFKNFKKLERVNLEENLLTIIEPNTFSGLTNLKELYFSHNNIKYIDWTTFEGSSSLEVIDLSNNEITSIDENAFSELKNLIDINLFQNQIRLFPNFPCKMLQFINLSKNQILEINFDLLKHLPDFCQIACRKADSNDMNFKYKQYFKIQSSEKISESLYNKYVTCNRTLNSVLNNKLEHLIKGELCFFVVRDENIQQKLLDFFFNIKFVTVKELKYLKDFVDFKISLLDFLIYMEEINSYSIIFCKKYIEYVSNQNKNYHNLEIIMWSGYSMKRLCERNDLTLFEEFFPIETLNSDLNKYTGKDFYSEINLTECLEIILKNNNEKIAIHFFRILKVIYKNNQKYSEQKFSLAKKLDDDSEPIIIDSFSEALIEKYLRVIFEKKWFGLVEVILDDENEAFKNKTGYLYIYSNDRIEKFKKGYLSDEFTKSKNLGQYQQLSTVPMDLNPDQNVSYVLNNNNKYFSEKDYENKYIFSSHNILTLIRKTQDPSLLIHDTTQRILSDEWKYSAGFIYYFNLILYFLLTVFFSFDIENYKTSDKTYARRISFILIMYFLISEILQLIASGKRILVYLASIKNWFELIGFIICTVSLSCENGSLKSALYSVSILVTYCILIFRLNKCFIIGPFVNVFGVIVKKSIKFFLIIFILVLGFSLSFRNRSTEIKFLPIKNSSQMNDINLISHFNGTFSNSVFKILTMLLANIETDEMGIDSFNWENSVNFIIYGCFILIMPILFINIFTGVSIDEVKRLIENSRAEHASNKIEYIFTIESILDDDKFDSFFSSLVNQWEKLYTFYF